MPADWGTSLRKAAGAVRNRAMARVGEALIAVWDGHSDGTGDMIAAATHSTGSGTMPRQKSIAMKSPEDDARHLDLPFGRHVCDPGSGTGRAEEIGSLFILSPFDLQRLPVKTQQAQFADSHLTQEIDLSGADRCTSQTRVAKPTHASAIDPRTSKTNSNRLATLGVTSRPSDGSGNLLRPACVRHAAG